MTQENGVQVETRPLMDRATEWEGLVVNGEFRLRQYLGGSDQSAVFLTEYDDDGPRQAAIKLIPEDPENAELQLSRWELATSLSHPHLLRVFQIGRCELANIRLLYIVMDYAEENLSQILPHRALTPEETRAMLPPALDALAYLHGKGLVHGHIKPSNIMASGDELKLSIDSLCRVGDPGSGFGPYTPPEAKNAGQCAAGDAWSLGMSLVEVLTQRLPTPDRVDKEEPAVPETLPSPFYDIARNCLREDPRRRWTVTDIALGLQALPPREEQVKPEPAVHTGPERPKRHSVTPIVVIGLLLVIAVMGPKLFRHEPTVRTIPSSSSSGASTSSENRKSQEDLKNARSAVTQAAPERKPNFRETASPPVPSPGENSKVAVRKIGQAEVTHQVLPEVPQKARDSIRGTVRVVVRASVDASGSVTEAVLDSPGPSMYFSDLALRAARQWQFSPTKGDGENASSEWILRFDFSNTDTRAVSTQIANNGHRQ